MNIEDELQTEFKSPQSKAAVNLRYTSNNIGAIQSEFMSQFDLSMPQFNILRILRGAGEAIAVNTVKERMIEKSPNTTRLMDKLINKNLISREKRAPDLRVIYVKITAEGQKLLRKIDCALTDHQNILVPDITDEEANQLSDLLDKIRNASRG
ncbi:MarR family winged helix-turn-helix transcriptional regulator [Crocinitomicaceae bacterium]|nr:MarR family winged helix-turn-helix transcriptional regulator [Crocinitomicaceae bacterium]